MFDTILVPLDGSQLAECVLPHIAAIAHSFDAEVILLRMLEKNQAGASAQLFDLLNWQISKTEAERYLERIRAQFQESGLRARSVVLEGLAAEGITEYAQSHDIKLIVLSSTWTQRLESLGDQQHHTKDHHERTNIHANYSGTPIRSVKLLNYQNPQLISAFWYRWMVRSVQKMFYRSSHNWLIFISLKFMSPKSYKHRKWRANCPRHPKISIYPIVSWNAIWKKPRIISNR